MGLNANLHLQSHVATSLTSKNILKWPPNQLTCSSGRKLPALCTVELVDVIELIYYDLLFLDPVSLGLFHHRKNKTNWFLSPTSSEIKAWWPCHLDMPSINVSARPQGAMSEMLISKADNVGENKVLHRSLSSSFELLGHSVRRLLVWIPTGENWIPGFKICCILPIFCHNIHPWL